MKVTIAALVLLAQTPLVTFALVPANDITGISVGASHVCAVTSGGGVKCWGDNFFGQLGDERIGWSEEGRPDRLVAVGLAGLAGEVASLASGAYHTCALTKSGGVQCWGSNGSGELGDGSSTGRATPGWVNGLESGVSAIAAGGHQTCALLTSGGVKCWGNNVYGQLGDGSLIDRYTPVDVLGVSSGVLSIAVGDFHACAVTASRKMKCWGANNTGALGDGTVTSRSAPVDVVNFTESAEALTAGNGHTCVVTTGGGAMCWGHNIIGQVGDNTGVDRTSPVHVLGLTSGVVAVSAGSQHTCALLTSGAISCWGSNQKGQLGDQNAPARYSPSLVANLNSVVASVAAGGSTTCVVGAVGVPKCWGDDGFGQLGRGGKGFVQLPLDVKDLPVGVSSVASGHDHSCAVTSTGGAKCWGRNFSGQLGDGSWINRTLPRDVVGLSSGVTAIAAGFAHSCALTSMGAVKCWGSNNSGQLGGGPGSPGSGPVDVVGLSSGVVGVAAGVDFTCALTQEGGVKCWGSNYNGQIGDGSGLDRFTPSDVAGLTANVLAIAVGYRHACALVASGAMKCWGRNIYGELGDASFVDRPTPVDVVGLSSGVAGIAAGQGHSCALKTDGEVRCWGTNGFGQLGDGTGASRDVPTAVIGLSGGLAAISAGGGHTCVLTTLGGVKCWGYNEFGQLGDGSTTNRYSPVDALGMTSGVSAVSTGTLHTCARTVAGEAKCWGGNFEGQLGNGSAGYDASPGEVLTFDGIVASVSSALTHTLALDSEGRVYAWGSDSHGQLGLGRAINRPTPTPVPGIPAVHHVSLSQHVLAVEATGARQVWSWGDNSCGQLGPRETTVTTKPSLVVGVGAASKVASGGCFSLALREDGTVWGWGLVPGYGTDSGVRQLSGLSAIVDIQAGATHALALRGDGTVWSLGDNTFGQLGTGAPGPAQPAQQVPALAGVVEIAAGRDTSAVRLSTGQVYVWGRRGDEAITPSPALQPSTVVGVQAISLARGELQAVLADGSVAVIRPPGASWQVVPGYIGMSRIEAGEGFSVGIGGAGQIYAQGSNTAGQLGQGTMDVYPGVVPVPGMNGAVQVAAGTINPSVLVRKADGSLWFWGADTLGESGDGAAIGGSVPQLVNIPARIRQIAAGDRFSVALDVNGDVWGWGDNGAMPLDGTLVNRSTPARIPTASNVQAIAAGGGFILYHHTDSTLMWSGTLAPGHVADAVKLVPLLHDVKAIAAGTSAYALQGDNRLFSFGGNASGELGNGTSLFSPMPVAVQGIGGLITGISAGRKRASAVTSDGKVWSWGLGPLGNGTATGSAVAVQATGVTDAVEVSVGRAGTVARRQHGGLLAWGDVGLADSNGQNTALPYALALPTGIRTARLGSANGIGFFIGSTGLLWGYGRYLSVSNLSSAIGDGTYVPRNRAVVVHAPGAAGNVDTGNWYFDLEPGTAELVPPAFTPRVLGRTQLSGYGEQDGVTLSAGIKVRQGDVGKTVGTYIFGYVPPAFLSLVKTAPSLKRARIEQLQKSGEPVFVQLTPEGWTDAGGQLIAYTAGVISGAEQATKILEGTNVGLIPGARFCIGYGESAEAMLTAATLQEVLALDGTSASVGGLPCVLNGVYVSGPPTSKQGSPVTFRATVVGLSPTGSVQFTDGSQHLLQAVPLGATSDATASASIITNSLALGTHSIGAEYSGDTQNAARPADLNLLHEVTSPSGGVRVEIMGPISSVQGGTLTIRARVTGSNPSGTVQFRDNGVALGAAVPLFNGEAILSLDSLSLGPHSITASYSGDGGNAPGTSEVLVHTVVAAASTTVTLASNANPALYGMPVVLTAGVSGASPGGSVAFRAGASVLGTVALSGGSASLEVGSLAPGLHEFRADYLGDGTNAPASSDVLYLSVILGFDPLADGDGDGIPDGVEIAVGRSRFMKDNDIFSPGQGSARLFAMQQFRDFLNREADPYGLAFWTDAVATGSWTRAAVIDAFLNSQEFAGFVAPVVRLYFATFLRTPDYPGLVHNAGLVRSGALSVAQLADFFANSPEFLATYGALDNAQFVTLLYSNVLGRAPDPDGLNGWVALLNGGYTRGQVLLGFSDSVEYQASMANEVFVTMMYAGMLRRTPEPTGFTGWVNFLDAGTYTREQVINGFFLSTEYRARFLP